MTAPDVTPHRIPSQPTSRLPCAAFIDRKKTLWRYNVKTLRLPRATSGGMLWRRSPTQTSQDHHHVSRLHHARRRRSNIQGPYYEETRSPPCVGRRVERND